jgi:hypothetical protein
LLEKLQSVQKTLEGTHTHTNMMVPYVFIFPYKIGKAGGGSGGRLGRTA